MSEKDEQSFQEKENSQKEFPFEALDQTLRFGTESSLKVG